jgi:EAL domain-containing protein (putative c-di-GMP-specific phosphodiesterase class I)
VRSVIDLGHNLGLRVTAEGVENQETWDMLAGMGCDMVQGYFVSPPLAPPNLHNWLSDRRQRQPEAGMTEAQRVVTSG